MHAGGIMGESATATEPPAPRSTAPDSRPVHPGELRARPTALRSWLALPHSDTVTEDGLILATNEAPSNAIDHASPGAGGQRCGNTVDVTVHVEPGTVCIEITDHGTRRDQPPNPTAADRASPTHPLVLPRLSS